MKFSHHQRAQSVARPYSSQAAHQPLPLRTAHSLSAQDLTRLEHWLSGELALTRNDAHQLLARAFDSGQLARSKPIHVAGVKALAAGPDCWIDMGYRLLSD